jgi:hypothetical protein
MEFLSWLVREDGNQQRHNRVRPTAACFSGMRLTRLETPREKLAEHKGSGQHPGEKRIVWKKRTRSFTFQGESGIFSFR